MSTDSIADLLTRIRNAQLAGHSSVLVRVSKLNRKLLTVLKGEGFLGDYSEVTPEGANFPLLRVELRYRDNGYPVISSCQRVSKCGRRVYVGADGVKREKSGLGISVISTSQGLMSDRDARKRGIGGEVVAVVS